MICSPFQFLSTRRCVCLLPGVLWLSTLSSCTTSPPAAVPASQVVEPSVTSAQQKTSETLATEPRVVEIDAVKAHGSFLAPMPRAVTSFGAAIAQGSFYLLGGYFGTPHAYSKEGQSRDVMRLDLSEQGTWQKVATLERGLQGLTAVHHEGRLCHFGGNHASNPEGTDSVMTSVKTARCLELESGSWTSLPDLPQGRSSFGAAVVDGKVYLVGGWTLSGDASTGEFVTDVLVLDLDAVNAKWESVTAPFARRALGVTAVGKNVIVVGGMTSQGKTVTDVDILDTTSQSWTKGPEHPGDAFGIAIAGAQSEVFASGREGVLRSLRLGESKWKEVRPLGLPRFFHEMRLAGEHLIVVGGIGGMHTRGRTRAVERLPLGEDAVAYGQMTFPTPGRAKNRQGIVLEGEQIYLFGGNLSLGQHDFERSHFTNEGWKLDLATLSFTEAPPFPLRRQSMQTLSLDDRGLAVGGFGHEPLQDPASEALSQREVLSYSFEENAWTQVGELPKGRTQFGLTQQGEKLWIFGGLNYDPERDQPFEHDQTIWVSDPEEISFSELDVTLPGPRRAFAGAKLDGKYYLIGGMKENFQLVTDCLVFDFGAKTFSQIPCPAARLSGALIPAGGKLYLVGGSVKTESGLEESRGVEVYDPEQQAWTSLDFEIPFSTRHMRAFPFHNQILLLSTHNDQQEMIVGLLNPKRTRPGLQTAR